MFNLRNGSLLANGTLVALGAILGAVGMWFLGPRGLETRIVEKPPSTQETPKRRARDSRDNDAVSRAADLRERGAQESANVAAAMREAESMKSQDDRLEYLRGFYGEWAKRDAQAAADHARATWNSGDTQTESVAAAIGQWARRDPRAAWQWSEANLSGPMKERTLTGLLESWTRESPRSAANWLAESGLTTQAYFNAVAGAWAASNPREAAEWAKGLADVTARDTAQASVANEWARQEPAEAAKHFAPQIASPESPKIDLATAIADIWGTTDPAATARWVASLPEGPGRAEAASTLATVWAASDIDAAVAWSGNLADAETRRRVIQHIGTTWGAIEPDRALDWLNTLPPNEAANGVEGALHSWAATDPIALRDWIDQAPAGAQADQARLSLGDVMTDTDLPGAMDLALGIADAAKRDQALTRFHNAWRKTDPQGASDWLTEQWGALPQGARNKLSK